MRTIRLLLAFTFLFSIVRVGSAFADANPCSVLPDGSGGWIVSCSANVPPTVMSAIFDTYNGNSPDGASTYGGIGSADDGDNGGNGGSQALDFPGLSGSFAIETFTTNPAPGVHIEAIGGDGGGGGNCDACTGSAGDGGTGGTGGSPTVTIEPNLSIFTQADSNPGVWVVSAGGRGGNGGDCNACAGSAGSGGSGGGGGDITVNVYDNIITVGNQSVGIVAQSLGGGGGESGGGILNTGAGNGGASQNGGSVTVNFGLLDAYSDEPGSITTYGNNAIGILAQSVGGHGGAGGSNGNVLFGSGGNGGNAGSGGLVTVNTTSDSSITTYGQAAAGIEAESVGGNGGEGGDSNSAFYSSGGSGSAGGNGGTVHVNNGATIVTYGAASKGIFAQSIGGGGGDGGSAGAIVGLGGSGSSTSPGGDITVNNSGNITTNSTLSLTSGQNPLFGASAIFAQSIGGGGGNGGSGSGLFSVGGGGGGGGDGGVITVGNSGTLTTNASDSSAIFAQSVGGGGGNGGGSVAVSAGASVGIGGAGGDGGVGHGVTVNSSGTIDTYGARSNGIEAQSVGGGGGNGGFAISVSAGFVPSPFDLSLGIGGTGGNGGAGGTVNVTSATTIGTSGDNANGIFAQSLGGGGGNGGFDVSASVGGVAPVALSLGIGGNGGGGGDAKIVTLANSGAITTAGKNANGILAQSIGGGGGNGGFSVSASGGAIAGSFSLGGAGGTAGNGSDVTLTNSGGISTSGAFSDGILAQSIGGGGGNGGFSVAGAIGAGSAGLSIGGNGSGGGTSGNVSLTNSGTVTTFGDDSAALAAESLAGGGGNGGFSVTGDASYYGGAGFSLGGSGSGGGNVMGSVTLINSGILQTSGDRSNGMLAQSIGGGGGNGGFSVTGSASAGPEGSGSIGGSGAGGGNGNSVYATNNGSITTGGYDSSALLAQSIGGGGGNGGFSVAGGISGKTGAVAFSMGGSAGAGGSAGLVSVNSGTSTNAGTITTYGSSANGIAAESLGGGGGNGGFSVAGSVANGSSINVGIGGSGGGGGSGGEVDVTNYSTIATGAGNATADFADGILAESIGGGGGNGGFGIGGTLSQNMSANVGVGGSGGTAGNGGNVTLYNYGAISTNGYKSEGALAQSIGGGGGNGGFSVAGGISNTSSQISLSLGGGGGGGGNGFAAQLFNYGNVTTLGNNSAAVEAQSLGGGGGNGGFSITATARGSQGFSGSFSLGGGGGNGGSGGLASVTNGAAQLLTAGDSSDGILAQSIGGGGGHGGWSVAGTVATGKKNLTLSFGGKGGAGAHGGAVQVTSGSANTSTLISTSGPSANGIMAESIGGGGGDGGWNVEAMASAGSSLGFGMGGNGGTGDNATSVNVTNYSTIQTTGNNSNGIAAQAIGGGGGAGGFNDNTNLAVSTDQKFGIGLKSMNNFGNGGGGGNGGEDPSIGTAVTVNNYGTITTYGENSNGILAESIGGGGGYGGFSYASQLAGDAGIGLGSSADGGGNGEKVSVTNAGSIGTLGDNSAAIEAQSIGMGGGAGGFALSGGLNTELGAKFGSLLWALGANGGHGGNGGDVTVNSTATLLSTQGANSAGILAQSLGAGGGSGGTATVGDVSLSKYLAGFTLGVGGQAGSTGNGGNVTVNNGSSIVTQGDNSDAILGQSIGGGGGNGGNSASVLALLGLNASLAIGGNGGAGGSGGTVNITSDTGSISTTGFESSGIVAESIGGGGGNGGSKVSGLPIPIDSLLGFTLGGNGGGSGDGGTASITNSSAVSTTGIFSEDLVAQSLGGGGGVAGTGFLDAANTGITGPILLGATGGTPGNGGAASASNSAQITTTGLGSAAIVAQSLGGGGGLAQLDITGSVTETAGGLTFGASGISGAPGSSAAASATDSGFASTNGDASDAMLAQSISAGGGLGIFDVGSFASPSLQIAEGASTADLGTSGNANITTSSGAVLQTLGFNSNAIAAQSIAGGGGSGITIAGSVAPSTAISYAVGATGTSGTQNSNGSAGNVTVSNGAKQIVTNGDLSNVILAQSIGGGGGDAAFKIGGTLSNSSISGTLGGSQLSAGTGGTVNVTNTGLIGANGNGSLAILAQSIGGGGGFAGFGTLSGTVTNGAFTLGGTGDSGTSGGTAQITNSGKIINTGNGDAGMLAQSIGGGGGVDYANLNLGKAATTLNLLTGENGGSSNIGGAASATNTAQIITSGVDSFGVTAQSIGGGGGNDPLFASGTLTTGSSGNQFSMQLGALGSGSGNNAGTVSVANNVPLNLGPGETTSTEDLDWDEAPLTTAGDGSIGVLGQSIGAGGGNGYLAFNGAFSTGMPKNAVVQLGSSAGQSGDGNTVTVNASGGVLTGQHPQNGHWSGAFADGILGQSIGGGGGNAVLSLELGLPSATAVTGNVSVNVGGHGTGNGGDVTLSDVNGSVLTFGGDAPAVIAQSIGGGGGNGAVNVFGPVKLSPPSKNPGKYTLNENVGGSGSTGNGGTVNLTQSNGIVQTIGDSSQGILAQSIGGGGGTAGPIHTINEFAANWCSTYGNNCTVHFLGANVAIGGNGSTGNGGAVTVANTGTILTGGEDASAILAQSIGGGGGIGGDADIIGGPSLTLTAGRTTTVGGTNGASGNGNTVSVTDAGAISTQGDNSSGIFAQSIGGGGGVGGLGLGSAWGSGTTLLGGSGGASGNGGAVNVTVNNVTASGTNAIYTTGKAAFGIFAQSVGGGGGLAGDVSSGVSASALGKGSKLTATGGGGGNGGAVTVVDNGNIKTTGSGADGIFAQSIGGGGGLTTGYAGSAGAAGNAGNVSVTQNGIIETTGNNADAIFAQSAGGSGTGGNVNVTVTGMALAYGSNSDGILAQSTGSAGNGSINITINANSVVQGGTGSGSAGVVMIGGSNNTLVNHGTITTAGSPNAVAKPLSLYDLGTGIVEQDVAQSAGTFYQTTSLMTDKTSLLSTFTGSTQYSAGTAVSASGGTLNLNNQGNIYGSLAMNGTSLNFINSGTFVSGSQLNLGTGTMSLASGSVMTPGAGGFVASTDLFGNFIEESGSDYLVTLDLNNNAASLLNVSGTASLGGAIDLDLLGTNAAAPGSHSDTILTAGAGLSNDGAALTPPQSAIATFNLGYLPNALLLNYDVNYAPTVGRMLSANDLSFGNYIGAIQTAGSTPQLAHFMSNVFEIPTVPKLKTFYDRFTPAASVAIGSSALFSNLQFSDQMLRCHDNGIVSNDGNCSWGTLGVNSMRETPSFSSVGFDQNGNAFAAGFEHRIGDGHTSVGAAIRYSKDSLFDSDAASSVIGGGLEAGVSASRVRHDGFVLSASLTAGDAHYKTDRQIGYPSEITQAVGSQDLSYLGLHARAQKHLGSAFSGVTPYVDFGVTRLNVGGLDESGAGLFNEHVDGYRSIFPTISSGLRLERSTHFRRTMVRAGLDLSVTQLLGNAQTLTSARLAGAPASIAPFMLTNSMDRTHFELAPSLQVSRENKFNVRIGGTFDFSRGSHSGGAYIQFGTKM